MFQQDFNGLFSVLCITIQLTNVQITVHLMFSTSRGRQQKEAGAGALATSKDLESKL